MTRFGGFGGCVDRSAQYARACCAQPLARFLSLLKSALVGGAVLGLVQPAFAYPVEAVPTQSIFPTSGQGIYAALLDLDKSSPKASLKPAPARRDDDAFSALAGFAQTVAAAPKPAGEKAATSPQADDAIYAELSEFAERVGAKRPVAREPRLQLAEADNAMDALKDFLRQNGTPAPVAPQAPVGEGPPAPGLTHTSSARTFA